MGSASDVEGQDVEGESGEGQGEDGQGDAGEGEGEGNGEEGDKGEGLNGVDGIGAGKQPGQGIKGSDWPSQLSARKIWQERLFEDYDEEVELGTRNLKMALRRVRKLTRSSSEEELDLQHTIQSTAQNGGMLDIKLVPELKNSVKVLLFLDVGGSMDAHIEMCAQLFSATRAEFKHLEFFYYHNFVYDSVWKSNERRQQDKIKLLDIPRTYSPDYKVIFVGDAHMGRHEITEKGGSVESYNAQTGQNSMNRITEHFRKVVWINPLPQKQWPDSPSLQLVSRLLDGQMYYLSVEGLTEGMRYLAK